MEEASAIGDLDSVRKSFATVVLSYDENIPFTDRILPGAKEVIERSACLAAEHGHVHVFSFLLDQGASITEAVVKHAFAANGVGFCQALVANGWDPHARKVPLRLVDPSPQTSLHVADTDIDSSYEARWPCNGCSIMDGIQISTVTMM